MVGAFLKKIGRLKSTPDSVVESVKDGSADVVGGAICDVSDGTHGMASEVMIRSKFEQILLQEYTWCTYWGPNSFGVLEKKLQEKGMKGARVSTWGRDFIEIGCTGLDFSFILPVSFERCLCKDPVSQKENVFTVNPNSYSDWGSILHSVSPQDLKDYVTIEKSAIRDSNGRLIEKGIIFVCGQVGAASKRREREEGASLE